LFSPSESLEFKGRWWITGDRFCFNVIGIRSYFDLVRENGMIRLFDSTGTLFGEFRKTPEPVSPL
jgi:hypothetical protein